MLLGGGRSESVRWRRCRNLSLQPGGGGGVTVPEYCLPRDGEIGYFISAWSSEVMDVERWVMDHDGAPVQVWHRKTTDVLNQQWLVRELAERVFAVSPRSGPAKAP